MIDALRRRAQARNALHGEMQEALHEGKSPQVHEMPSFGAYQLAELEFNAAVIALEADWTSRQRRLFDEHHAK